MQEETTRKRKICRHCNYVIQPPDAAAFFQASDKRISNEENFEYLKLKYPGCKIFEVPCGKCAICYKNKIRAWARSLTAELLTCDIASFYTLTFDDEHLPSSLEEAKRTFQLFIKRLRKIGLKFKYFAVSEFGELNGRVHFHALFFGLPPHLDTIKEEWQFGFIDSSSATVGRIYYVVGYMFKAHGLRLYSKALGYKYFDDLHSSGRFVDYYGQSVILPRKYYRLTRWTESERQEFNSQNENLESLSTLQLRDLDRKIYAEMKRKKQL